MQKTHKYHLDEIDKAILSALQQNCHLSNVELARKVHLSESACLRRVKLIEASGIIDQFALLLKPAVAGIHDTVFVRITLESQQQERLQAFEDAVKKIEEVMECYLMSGQYDYMLKILCTDNDDYKRIHHRLTGLPGVNRILSSFVLHKVIKKTEIPVHADSI